MSDIYGNLSSNQSIITFVFGHSTTVLMAYGNNSLFTVVYYLIYFIRILVFYKVKSPIRRWGSNLKTFHINNQHGIEAGK